jgi:hypothetical protein
MKMNRSLLSRLMVCGIVLGLVSTVAAQTETLLSAKVLRVKGSARYKVGNGPWQTLKAGDLVQQGTVIETGMNDSRVDFMLGSGTPPSAKPIMGEAVTYHPSAEQNTVRIWENSRLAIDKGTLTRTGADEVTDIKLDLQAGHIIGSVKKLSAASTYEVKIPNGVAGIRGTVYDISVEGVVKVLVGSVYLAYINPQGKATTQVIMGEQQFDMRTGVLTPMPNTIKTGMIGVIIQLKVEVNAAQPIIYSVDRTIVNFVSPH